MSRSLRRRRVASLAASVIAALSAVTAATLTANTQAVAVVGATTIQIDGQSRQVDGENVRRLTNFLVIYSNSGTSTGTNAYGFEAAVVDGKVTQVAGRRRQHGRPDQRLRALRARHDRTWLKARGPGRRHASAINGNRHRRSRRSCRTSASGHCGKFSDRRPDARAQFAGKKLLKFPGVTANVGDGRLEIIGTRSSSTSTDWSRPAGRQEHRRHPRPAAARHASFTFGGDGHNHWHIVDFDSYELLRRERHEARDGREARLLLRGQHGVPRLADHGHERRTGRPRLHDQQRLRRRSTAPSPRSCTASRSAGRTPTRPPCRTRRSTSPGSPTASTSSR